MSGDSGMTPFDEAFHASAERHERAFIVCVIVMMALLTVATMFYVVHDFGLVTTTQSFHSDPTAAEREVAAADTGRVVKTGPNSYAVHITGKAWRWTPGVIHVPEGAEVTFYVTSSDVLHGFEIQGTPVNLTAVPGVVGTVKYTFHRTGVFRIICNEYCGMMHHAMIGQVIVDARAAE
ncbi:cytochrome c oxidase subunit II [Acetobacter sacchari]|uniref:Cytochrome c oxidase subunit II n=1 Tax=Acetobacter sacchari TaxID=2661687 RepID=A0ABS3LVR4_9PROT|nr:cytochrome c oxidase subunit II [Acetobacter sacchari]MBO1360002.1 cytochrome c oxidase subunit II [Acetobacter sacchari]